MTPPRLRLHGISKSYAAPVLSGIDLEVAAGEAHALVGENGAGKSTLCKIVCGLVALDEGSLWLDGVAYRPANVAEADACGVRMVRQELSVVGTLSIAENIFIENLAAHADRWGRLRRPALNARAAALMQKTGLGKLNPETPVEWLGVGQQQAVEIARALAKPCRVLILDEPTAALTGHETDLLFEQIDILKREGTAILYISHRLEELRRICDRVTVLRDGRLVQTFAAASVSAPELVDLMAARAVARDGVAPPPAALPARAPSGKAKRAALAVEDLHAGELVRGVSFSVAEGEILGLSGLMGAGRTETLRALFGADRLTRGRVLIGPEARPANFRSPYDAVTAGFAFLSENRKEEGLLLPHSLADNITLPRLPAFARMGWIQTAAERAAATAMASALRVRCRDLAQAASELSGGNQQKLLLARWLALDPAILLVDEPTRGIDVAARDEIYALLEGLARQGKAIVVASSDLQELLRLCDRIAVMCQGRVVGTFHVAGVSPEALSQQIMAAAFHAHVQPPQPTRAMAEERS